MKIVYYLRSLLITLFVGMCITGEAQLYINEVMASNQCGPQDDFLNDNDWIEIFNDGGLVNLAGYYITDDPDTLTKYQIPFGFDTETFMAPNSYAIIWADFETDEGPLHSNFSLSADGETILLVAPDGETIIDQVTYPQLGSDVSYGRESDGAATWIFFSSYTFEDPNMTTVMPGELLFINEVQTVNISTYPDNFDEYDQWIEIYNPNSCPVNLAGYYISNTSDPLLFQIPNDDPYRTVIPALGFLLIWADNEPEQESNHANFTLQNSGGTITLTAPDGLTPVDELTYAVIPDDLTYGRTTDGGAGLALLDPTPRVSNETVIIVPPLLYINEVLTQNLTDTIDNYGDHEDWVEIFNPNDFPVSLVGYYMSDNPDNPVKWQVPDTYPDSVTVPANGWLLFWADEDAIQGVRHTSFRLNNNAEEVTFYSPDGFTVIDHISWVNMQSDTSLGRITDGAVQWWMFTGTTPEYSNNEGALEITEAMSTSRTFSVYPNPAVEWIKMDMVTNVMIYSVRGELVKVSAGTDRIDVSSLSPGVYILRTTDGSTARLIRS